MSSAGFKTGDVVMCRDVLDAHNLEVGVVRLVHSDFCAVEYGATKTVMDNTDSARLVLVHRE